MRPATLPLLLTSLALLTPAAAAFAVPHSEEKARVAYEVDLGASAWTLRLDTGRERSGTSPTLYEIGPADVALRPPSPESLGDVAVSIPVPVEGLPARASARGEVEVGLPSAAGGGPAPARGAEEAPIVVFLRAGAPPEALLPIPAAPAPPPRALAPAAAAPRIVVGGPEAEPAWPPAPLAPRPGAGAWTIALAGAAGVLAAAVALRLAARDLDRDPVARALRQAAAQRPGGATAAELVALARASCPEAAGLTRRAAEWRLFHLTRRRHLRRHLVDGRRLYTPYHAAAPVSRPLETRLVDLVRERPGLSVADAASALGVTRSRLDRCLRPLLASGVVQRSREDGAFSLSARTG